MFTIFSAQVKAFTGKMGGLKSCRLVVVNLIQTRVPQKKDPQLRNFYMGILLNMFLIAGWCRRILPSVGDVISKQVDCSV